MKQAGLILLLCLLSARISAQETVYPEAEISSINGIESRTLDDSFFGSYYFGKFIDSTTKWDAISALNEKNHFGVFSCNKADLWLPGGDKYRLYFTASHQVALGIGFTQKFFQLVFAGNDKLVNEHVMMDPGQLHQFEFSTVAGGISYTLTPEIEAYAAIGPVSLYNYSHVDFSRSEFFTSEAADSLSLQLRGEYSRTGGYAFIKGTGVSAELGLKGTTGSVAWKISAGNLGRVWLNRRTIDSQRDTTMKFTGIEVTDLALFSTAVDQELDSFEESLSLKGDTMTKSISLPFLLSGECQTQFGKWHARFGVVYYHLPGFIPLARGTVLWPLSPHLRVALPMKYGGYGSFNAGLGIEALVSHRITISVDFPSLLTFAGDHRNISYLAFGKIAYKIRDDESIW